MGNKIPLRVNKKAHHGISMNQQQLGSHNLRPSNAGTGNSRNTGLTDATNPYSHNYQRNRNLTMHNAALGSSSDNFSGNLIFNTTNDINQSS